MVFNLCNGDRLGCGPAWVCMSIRLHVSLVPLSFIETAQVVHETWCSQELTSTACCNLDFWLHNPIGLSVWASEYSLSVLSKLSKPFKRYRGNNIWPNERTNGQKNGCTGQRDGLKTSLLTLSGVKGTEIIWKCWRRLESWCKTSIMLVNHSKCKKRSNTTYSSCGLCNLSQVIQLHFQFMYSVVKRLDDHLILSLDTSQFTSQLAHFPSQPLDQLISDHMLTTMAQLQTLATTC